MVAEVGPVALPPQSSPRPDVAFNVLVLNDSVGLALPILIRSFFAISQRNSRAIHLPYVGGGLEVHCSHDTPTLKHPPLPIASLRVALVVMSEDIHHSLNHTELLY